MFSVNLGALGRRFLCYSLILASLAGPAYGQSGVGISPPRVELSASPGSQVSQTVQVDNPSAVDQLVVNVEVSDALLAPGGGLLWVPPGSNAYSLAPWLDINPLRFELGPGERRGVTYTVSVPADAADATYWAVLFFESSQPAKAGFGAAAGVGVINRVRVGHIVYVTVGQPTRSGEIVGVRYDSSGPVGAIAVNFHNTGTGLLRLDGRVELRDDRGDRIQTLSIDGQASFPGAVHEIGFPLSASLASGEYTALAVLNYGASQVILGEATVTVP